MNLVRKLTKGGDPGTLAFLVELGTPNDLKTALKLGSEQPVVLNALLESARVHGKKPSGDPTAALTAILEKKNAYLASLKKK